MSSVELAEWALYWQLCDEEDRARHEAMFGKKPASKVNTRGT